MPVHLLAHKRTCPSKAQHNCQCIVYYNRYRYMIYVYIYIYTIFFALLYYIVPVLPHKAVAEVSKIGNL